MMKILLKAVALLGLAIGLVACGSKGSAVDPPTQVDLVAGDGQIQVTWNGDPSVDWWLFYSTDPNMTLDNWTTISGARAQQKVSSPRMLTGLTNGQQYTIIINGRTSGGKGGDGSVPVFATPRPAGASWTPGTPLGTTAINGMMFTSFFIAVGDGGVIFTSPDGGNWIQRASPTTSDLHAVAFVNGRYVAVGASGAIVNSVDAINWSAVTPGTAATLRALVPSAAGFLAVGDAGTILRSTDGQGWIASNSGTSSNLRGATLAGGGVYVVVGDGGTILRSTSLLDWTPVATSITANLQAVTYSTVLARLVAVGQNGSTAYSDDLGAAWNPVGAITTANLNALVGGSRFVAVGAAGAVVRSDDGLTWTTSNSGSIVDLNSVSFGAGVFPAGGAGGTLLISK